MAINLAFATGTAVVVGATEMSLATTGGSTAGVPAASAVAGIYTLYLDGAAMLVGDEFHWRVYEKARAGGTARIILQESLLHAQSEMLVIPNLILGIGWDITLQRVSATSRAFDWSIRQLS